MNLTDIEQLTGTPAEANHAGITTDELLKLSAIATSLEHFDKLVGDYSDQVRGPDTYVIYSGPVDHVQVLADIIEG